MKGHYAPGSVVLDAGCGEGRNLHWFLQAGLPVFGTDINVAAISHLRSQYPHLPPDRFRAEPVEAMSFAGETFDHVVSSAVLHFAENKDHFFAMLRDMLRVLRPGGSLFIRMASDIGIEEKVQPLGNGVFALPDGRTRFLLTRSLLQQVLQQWEVTLLEPFKTVNVADMRCMSTLVLQLQ